MSRIYFFEALLANLRLDAAVVEDAGPTAAYLVKIHFIHFPAAEIRQSEGASVEHASDACIFEFNAGRAYHFSMRPEDLGAAMLKNPLKIGVYRVGDTFPACRAEVPFSGCLCDQILEGVEERTASIPFEFDGPFSLVDPGDNPAGSIDLKIALSNFGRYAITRYALQRASFIFKNDCNGAEYRCNRNDPELRENFEEIPPDLANGRKCLVFENLAKNIAGISPAANRLALGKPPAEPPRVLLRNLYAPVPEAKVNDTDKKEKKGKKKG